MSLPDSVAWMKAKFPGVAHEYICSVYDEMTKAIHAGDDFDYKIAWEKYQKAWVKIWRLMAEEHVGSRPIEETDMRYIMHMPDGFSFDFDSELTGGMVRVFPRKPKNPPTDIKWMTASDALKSMENPAIIHLIKEFGAWFTREDENRSFEELDDDVKAASKKRCREIRLAGGGKKLKHKKGGWDCYE